MEVKHQQAWKILVVDDDEDILNLTTVALSKLRYQDRGVDILTAPSGAVACAMLKEHQDIALTFIDLEMEHQNSGFELVHHIRKNLKNRFLRIVIRTGKKAGKSAKKIVQDYDVNDFLLKSETDATRLFVVAITSLRNHEALTKADVSEKRYREEAQERSRQLEIFKRFVPPALNPSGDALSAKDFLGVAKEAPFGVLFCDIRGFTTFAESISSTHCFNFLNSYFSVVTPEVNRYGGFVYQLLGDGILSMYPSTQYKAAAAMLHSAINIQDCIHIYNRGRIRAGYTPIKVGVGVNYGNVAIGISGNQMRMSAAAFGATINLASRCDDLSKTLGVNIITTEHVVGQLNESQGFLIRSLGRVRAKGLVQKTAIFEVFNADEPKIREAKQMSRRATDRGFELIDAGKYREAKQAFKAIQADHPLDPLPPKVIQLLSHPDHIYRDSLQEEPRKEPWWPMLFSPLKKSALGKMISRERKKA